jgi:hypothetical protein
VTVNADAHLFTKFEVAAIEKLAALNTDALKCMLFSSLVPARNNYEFLADLLATPIASPVISSVTTSGSGGTLAAGTYGYRVSALNALGETLASAEVTVVASGSTSSNTVNWPAVSGATRYRVYGRTAGSETLLATLGAVLTYVDTGAGTPAGVFPTVNSTGGAGVESSGAGYTAGGVSLTGVAVSQVGSVVTLDCDDPAWTGANFDAAFAVFLDTSPGSAATDPLICYWDLLGAQSPRGVPFSLAINPGGLATFTAS